MILLIKIFEQNFRTTSFGFRLRRYGYFKNTVNLVRSDMNQFLNNFSPKNQKFYEKNSKNSKRNQGIFNLECSD